MRHALTNLTTDATDDKIDIMLTIVARLRERNYKIAEINIEKPWGLYIRLENSTADQFIDEFFPGLSPADARLGNPDAELSPKLLLVAAGARLSWQYHNRRAERWRFLTEGLYVKSMTDEQPAAIAVQVDEIVQFSREERHRLVANSSGYTIVAEMWQHTDPDWLSDEDDIVRLHDDYTR